MIRYTERRSAIQVFIKEVSIGVHSEWFPVTCTGKAVSSKSQQWHISQTVFTRLESTSVSHNQSQIHL